MMAFRAVLRVEADSFLTDYTGRLVKAFVFATCRELTLLHGMRGIVSPLAISPLFLEGREELSLDRVVTPYYEVRERGRERALVPVRPEGDYVIHVGGERGVVEKAWSCINALKGTYIMRFNNANIQIRVEKSEDITKEIVSKEYGDKIRVYLKAPALIFNIYTRSRLPKFSPSAIEVLMTPYMIATNRYTLTYETLLQAAPILGKLIETYYTLKTLKPVFIPFKNKPEVALQGIITYIIDTNNPQEQKTIKKLITTTEITGIGESRLNGFGTTTTA